MTDQLLQPVTSGILTPDGTYSSRAQRRSSRVAAMKTLVGEMLQTNHIPDIQHSDDSGGFFTMPTVDSTHTTTNIIPEEEEEMEEILPSADKEIDTGGFTVDSTAQLRDDWITAYARILTRDVTDKHMRDMGRMPDCDQDLAFASKMKRWRVAHVSSYHPFGYVSQRMMGVSKYVSHNMVAKNWKTLLHYTPPLHYVRPQM